MIARNYVVVLIEMWNGREVGETTSRIIVNTINSEVRSTWSIQIGRGNHRSKPRVLAAEFTQVHVSQPTISLAGECSA
jgi:hypothetical protein